MARGITVVLIKIFKKCPKMFKYSGFLPELLNMLGLYRETNFIMEKYRIVTNGINYRVQWFGKTFFLRRPKWYYLRSYTYAGDYIPEFTTIIEAQQAIKCAKEQAIAKERGYIPIVAEQQP